MTAEERKAQNIENSGKGMSRVEIAQRAVDALRAKLAKAEDRLETAIRQAEERAEKEAKKAPDAIKRAIKNLRTAGLNAEADKLAKEHGITE